MISTIFWLIAIAALCNAASLLVVGIYRKTGANLRKKPNESLSKLA